MNERINELFEQAANREFPSLISIIHPNKLERFADLIIKECLDISNQVKEEYRKNRLATSQFDEKNIYAEGEAACDIIQYRLKN